MKQLYDIIMRIMGKYDIIMRISVMIIFIIGLIMFVIGSHLAIKALTTETWKSRSEVLASEKALVVSAGWISKNENLIDKIIVVDPYEGYDYWFAYKPTITSEAKDFVISGRVIELSTPQIWFNFYIFDSNNFELWTVGGSYSAIYEARGRTSYNFKISIASKDNVPDILYFVVEKTVNVPVLNPKVRVTINISWVEKAPIRDSSKYLILLPILVIDESKDTFLRGVITKESKDIVLKGYATEVRGRKFNFYIMDSENYQNWFEGKTYVAYFDEKNVSSTLFSIPLTKDQASSLIYIVVENPLLDVDETVKVTLILEWREKTTIATIIREWILGGVITILGFIFIMIAGLLIYILKQ